MSSSIKKIIKRHWDVLVFIVSLCAVCFWVDPVCGVVATLMMVAVWADYITRY